MAYYHFLKHWVYLGHGKLEELLLHNCQFNSGYIPLQEVDDKSMRNTLKMPQNALANQCKGYLTECFCPCSLLMIQNLLLFNIFYFYKRDRKSFGEVAVA